jgi:membrane-anchored protein YejM (alkaline phosphatase superfamily)
MSQTPGYSYYLIALMAILLLAYGVYEYSMPQRRRQAEQDQRSETRSVYLVTASGLRPDHLSCDQYQPIQTPQMDFLAQDGIRFKHAFTTSPDWAAAHLSLLTGVYPFRNSQDQTGLPALLGAHGYQTAAFVADPVLGNTSFLKWFGEVQTAGSSSAVRMVAERWILQHRDKPQLVLISFNEPTYPFQPPSPYSEQYANYPYDGETAALDSEVGLLIDFLKNAGLYRKSIIVFSAPYASRLDGVQNGAVSTEWLHVPLFITAPGLLPQYQTYANQVSLVDILPTILPLLNMTTPAKTLDGMPLFKKGIRDEVYRDLLFGAVVRPDGSLDYFAHSQAGDLYTGEDAKERMQIVAP